MAKANQERQDRLAQALRANLHRRKAQSRARKAGETAPLDAGHPDADQPDVDQSNAGIVAPTSDAGSVSAPEGGDQNG